ncbi:MAG: NYN domain-containing protein [Anaerolineales bacterium]
MPYLIDGHNLIGRLRDVSLADPDDEARLVALLQAWCTRHRVSATVFFDRGAAGQPSTAKFGRLTVRFARWPQTADSGMAAFLTQLGRGASQWIVVSSDGAVRASARRLGAKTLRSEEFATGLGGAAGEAASEKPDRSTPQEVSDWLRRFGRKKPR